MQIKVLVGVGLVIFVIFLFPFVIITPQQVGVVTRLGSINRVVESGFRFKIPFIEKVTRLDISINVLEVDEQTYSKDSQTVDAQVTLNYQLVPSSAEQIFREVKTDYARRLISPAVKDGIKAVFARYSAQGLIDNRAVLPMEVKKAISTELSVRGIDVMNVLITNLDFDDAYESAIKRKQIAEQEALQQINITKQEEEKKKQQILQAEALAEKTRLEVKALQSSEGKQIIEKIYAEAALEASKKWNGVLPVNMYGSAPMPFINLTDKN